MNKDNPVPSLDKKIVVHTIKELVNELSNFNDRIGDFEPIKWLITGGNSFVIQAIDGTIIELQNGVETEKN